MNFYRDLAERANWTHIKPFLNVINKLSHSKYDKALYPHTSMHNLVIASTPHYPERLHKPYIVLAPKKEGVEVTLGPSLKDYDRRFSFSYDEVFEEIQPLLRSLLGYTST